jgi:hypothetical protein
MITQSKDLKPVDCDASIFKDLGLLSMYEKHNENCHLNSTFDRAKCDSFLAADKAGPEHIFSTHVF